MEKRKAKGNDLFLYVKESSQILARLSIASHLKLTRRIRLHPNDPENAKPDSQIHSFEGPQAKRLKETARVGEISCEIGVANISMLIPLQNGILQHFDITNQLLHDTSVEIRPGIDEDPLEEDDEKEDAEKSFYSSSVGTHIAAMARIPQLENQGQEQYTDAAEDHYQAQRHLARTWAKVLLRLPITPKQAIQHQAT
ncbi:hypothetical protein ACQKWADRAFT_292910 [Trichoderma austrokoningii]